MKKYSLLLLLLLTALNGVHADNINVNGTTRSYIVYAPKNLGQNKPLLISCHGMNQDANYQKGMLAIESVADTAKFLTVFPQGEGNSWDISGDKDVNFMRVLIKEMVTKYKIDANRVYLSGFSMGGMFTYHAMNRLSDVIAAFAPISGYPMWGTTADAKVRPIPIIHTHGTGDDVVAFSGAQGALNVWINHNGCPTTARVVKKYRGASHITRHTWGPGNNGVEVVLMELADKGHWVANDVVKTGDEIWRFCKRYSLVQKDPSVSITAPKEDLSFVTIGGAPDLPTVTVEASASDPDGVLKSMSVYDGSELLTTIDNPSSVNTQSISYTIEQVKKGTHNIRVVATDDEGRTGEALAVVDVNAIPRNYVFTSFDMEGCVPSGWVTFDGQVRRVGASSGFTSGSRVFHFTGAQRDFDYGLYTRNIEGKERAGYARFAAEGTSVSLSLYPGVYQIYYKVCNWNKPDFSPVTIALETIDGQEVASHTFTPTANVGNDASKSFTGSTTLSNFSFDVTERGQYVITFYTDDAAWADLVVGQASIIRKGNLSGISSVSASAAHPSPVYDLQGRRVTNPQHGLYIQDGKKVMY